MPIRILDGDYIAHGCSKRTDRADVYESVDIRDPFSGDVHRLKQFVVPGALRSAILISEHARICYWAHNLEGAFKSRAVFPFIGEHSIIALRWHTSGSLADISQELPKMRSKYQSMKAIC